MPITRDEYFHIRAELLRDNQTLILAAERKYMDFLVGIIAEAMQRICEEFCLAMELNQFWVNYAPQQRGRAPKGTSIPWGEVGEKTLIANLVRAILEREPTVIFPGLPLGGDLRFSTSDALVHLDIKLTGPSDVSGEVVAPPYQVSGDGRSWRNGIINSPFTVTGPKGASFNFQPKLPPFYVLKGQTLICLTYFLKVVYEVRALGDQPLSYLELVCVPNGLALFDGPKYAQTTKGLLRPGKDKKKKREEDRRTRIEFDPLASLGGWRCVRIELTEAGCQITPRNAET
jgi:Restriction endonuclease BglI